jgi:hypothetical protein
MGKWRNYRVTFDLQPQQPGWDPEAVCALWGRDLAPLPRIELQYRDMQHVAMSYSNAVSIQAMAKDEGGSGRGLFQVHSWREGMRALTAVSWPGYEPAPPERYR